MEKASRQTDRVEVGEKDRKEFKTASKQGLEQLPG